MVATLVAVCIRQYGWKAAAMSSHSIAGLSKQHRGMYHICRATIQTMMFTTRQYHTFKEHRFWNTIQISQEWIRQIWKRKPKGAAGKIPKDGQWKTPRPLPPGQSRARESRNGPFQQTKSSFEQHHSQQQPPPPFPGGGGGGGGYPLRLTDFILPVAIAIGLSFLTSGSDRQAKSITWQEFYSKMLSRGEVSRLVMDRDRNIVHVYLHDGAVIQGYNDDERFRNVALPHFQIPVSSVRSFERKIEAASEELGVNLQKEITLVYMTENDDADAFWLLLIIGSALALMYTFSRGRASPGASKPFTQTGRSPTSTRSPLDDIMSVGKIKPHIFTAENATTKFKDVAGLTEAKAELKEFVAFLTNPEQFQTLGATVPKGAMLVGPPGTGKTLLAKAVAGEADVPFLTVSGSDFVEMFVGVGPSRVRDLFKRARELAPCIVYIDEIDAVGRARGAAMRPGGGHSERESTLNQLLVEMDGFNSSKGCLVLASTNRVDILDKALLRPGRFDRRITCDLPTIKEREDIFRVHTRDLPLAAKVSDWFSRLASLTAGLSGAQIAAICNEAALHAARFRKAEIQLDDFDYAIDRVIAGIERKSRIISKEEKKVFAYHEAGHVLVGWFLKTTDPILKVSIIPRGTAVMGHSQYFHGNHYLLSQEQINERIISLLGGRAAEEVVFSSITTGARDDLEKVTNMAYDIVMRYGMRKKSGLLVHHLPSTPGEGKKKFSKHLSSTFDFEAHQIVQSAFCTAKSIVEEHLPQLHQLGERLIEAEVLTYEDIASVLGPPASGKSPSDHVVCIIHKTQDAVHASLNLSHPLSFISMVLYSESYATR